MPKLILLFTAIIFSVQADAVNLPLKLNEDNIQQVTFTLNGKPIDFILDLGSAEGMHLNAEMQASLPTLRADNRLARSIDLAGNVMKNSHFTIGKIDINGETFRQVSGVEYQPWGRSISDEEHPQPEAELPVAGLSLFKHHRFMIDVRKGVMTLDPADHPLSPRQTDGWITLPFKLQEEGVVVQATHQGKTVKLLIDSAASWSMLKRIPGSSSSHLQRCSDVSDKLPTNQCQLTSIRINQNGQHLTDLTAVVFDELPPQFEADGLLGTNFFEKFRVRIDMQNHLLQVQRYP